MAPRRKRSQKKTDDVTAMMDELAEKMARVAKEANLDVLEVQRLVLGRAISTILEGEMSHHLGYTKGGTPPEGEGNRRNGTTAKKVRTSLGPVEIDVPRDREGAFEPQVVPKYKRSLKEFDQKILALYARGMSVRDIQRTLEEIYGTEVSPELISRVTDAVLDDLKEWRSRPLERMYYLVYIDALFAKTRQNGSVTKRAVYTVVGVAEDGTKDVLGMYISESESAKVWMGVLEDLRRRGVERIGVIAADGLTGLGEAIEAVYPSAVFQTCVVHLIRASVRLVPWKDRKALCADLRKVYTAGSEEEARHALDAFKAKWDARYPMVAKKWEARWDEWTPFLALPEEARRAVYTTNAIEGLHRLLRKVIKTRGAFPSDEALLKVLYLTIRNAESTWGRPSPYWGRARVQLAIHFDLAEA